VKNEGDRIYFEKSRKAQHQTKKRIYFDMYFALLWKANRYVYTIKKVIDQIDM
jgi:hypothetical protein